MPPKRSLPFDSQGIIAVPAIQKLGIGEQLLRNRVVRVEFGRLFGRYLSLFVALFVTELVEFVDQQSDFFFCLLLYAHFAFDVLASAIVFIGQFQTRLILIDILLGFADGAIDPAQQLIAHGGFQTGLFHFFAAFFKGTQGAIGICFAHRPGIRFQVGQVGGDLPGQDLLPGRGLIEQIGLLAAQLGRGMLHGLESNCK